MRLRFDETTLTKTPTNPISTDVEPAAPPSVASYLDLCHVPAEALPWLFTRTTAQVNAAAMVGKVAYEAGSPVASAALLRHDHNVLVMMFGNGSKLAVYPDGSIGHEGQVLACTPESVQAILGPTEPEMGMGPAMGAPEPVQADSGIPMGGMTDLAGGPQQSAEEALGEPSELGQIGDPVQIDEPMIDPEFFGDRIEGLSPTDEILAQVGAEDGPQDLPLALVDDKGTPTRGERRRR